MRRRRGPAKKKDDAEDARIACLLALDRFERPRPLIPHGEVAGEPRATARDDERAARDERRLRNRPRQDLPTTFPDALEIAGAELAAPTFLRPLERWPSTEALRQASRGELAAFARTAHHGRPERFADTVEAALAAEHFQPRPSPVRAKADTIRLTASQLLTIGKQRRARERRIGEPLLGARRQRRARQPRQDERRQSLPGGEAYPSLPGRGDRLAAWAAGETGDHPEQIESPNALQRYAGKAPVTRRPGKRELVVSPRLADNRHLGDTVQQSASSSLRSSPRPRTCHDTKQAAGTSHTATPRTLGNRSLELLRHRPRKHTHHDQALHTANRTRALTPLAKAA